jgi:hypothetical protein
MDSDQKPRHYTTGQYVTPRDPAARVRGAAVVAGLMARESPGTTPGAVLYGGPKGMPIMNNQMNAQPNGLSGGQITMMPMKDPRTGIPGSAVIAAPDLRTAAQPSSPSPDASPLTSSMATSASAATGYWARSEPMPGVSIAASTMMNLTGRCPGEVSA